MNYPIVDLGGAGQTLNLAPANGIPPETYRPFLRRLHGVRAVSMLPRALWPGESVPTTLGTWETDVARDLLDGLRAHGVIDVIGVGHSFGGIATALAALEEPSRFRALVLLDPTILLPSMFEALDAMREAGALADFPLASRARKRQRSFPDAAAAYDYFRPRGMFKDWDEEAVRLYVAYGLVPAPDGGLALGWSPEWEAYYFMTGYTGTWDVLPRLAGLLPTLIVRGAVSDTYVAESAARVRELLPDATHVEIAGHGHLFPQSAPAETAQVVNEWLARQ